MNYLPSPNLISDIFSFSLVNVGLCSIVFIVNSMSPWTESGIFGCSSSLFPDKTWRKKGIYFNLSMNNAKQAIVRKVNDKIIIFPEATAQSAVRAVSLRRGYYSAQLFTPGKSRGGSRIFRGVVSGGSYFWQGGGWWGCMGVVAFAGCVLFAKKCYVKNYCFAQCQANIQFLSRNRLTSINWRFKNCYLIAYFVLLHGWSKDFAT